ncbi:MAG: PstS family phosphate ABC transporter substrate-binding protein, partial [Verrucomicrobia bacterium]|nr:PstS family phosphate ABC transporter substrate-binding protein [Verrucomicrobiota bacterium]
IGCKPTRLGRVFCLMLLAGLIAGCSAGKPDKIVILGSNTIGEDLAPRLVAEYKKEHPTVAFEMEFKGTTYGLGALMVRRCDIAAASREVTTNEVALAKTQGVEFSEHVIGAYDVAVIVNAANPITNLTRAQVRDLFTGAVQNWKDVGGPDAPVQLFIRHPISGTYLGFRELAMEDKPYALSVKTFTNYTGIVEAVSQNPNGIGYCTLALDNKPGLKPVSIGGIAPSAAAVNKGRYPYARLLRLYTENGRETPLARDFVQFVESRRGQAILEQAGYTPQP